jgi:pimeloyl-ACP methyl ester carboxylesterase
MTDSQAETLLFLPGASGNTDFWKPVSDRLRHPGQRRFMAWPGFGGVPVDPGVRGIDDLVARVVDSITGPVDLLAQSMGGVIAMRAALQKPGLVKHLVLAATSGGLDLAALGGQDWRPEFLTEYPNVPRWFIDEREDLTDQLAKLTVPVLLLWGNADPISPLAVGHRLAASLPRAEIVVVDGGTHTFIYDRANAVLPDIERHLAQTT